MAESLSITGLSWADGSPRIRVRRNGAPSELEPLVGFRINYQSSPGSSRTCIGHRPFRSATTPWIDCDNTPLHDGRTCDRCAASDATFASQLHHAHNKAAGELDPAVLTHLQQPNNLYLAAFRDGSIKVGTSTAPRLQTRLDEQGAWFARVVAAATDGFAVRSIEDQVTVRVGLPQSVSIHRKLDGLEHPRPDEVLLAELDLWTGRVHELIEGSGDARLSPAADDWRFSQADDPMFNGLHRYPLKLASGAHDLEFLGASGRAIVLARPGRPDRFVTDLRKLYGIDLATGDHVPDELAVQDSLF
ncbi:MAG: hypothetical protein ACR2P0_20515 [Acidimicrobiales bacterium]